MYFNPFDYKTNQIELEERIHQAQLWHAQQHRIMQQLDQALNWLGRWLIAWRRHIQLRPHALTPKHH